MIMYLCLFNFNFPAIGFVKKFRSKLSRYKELDIVRPAKIFRRFNKKLVDFHV